jgi:hypothetical protein
MFFSCASFKSEADPPREIWISSRLGRDAIESITIVFVQSESFIPNCHLMKQFFSLL